MTKALPIFPLNTVLFPNALLPLHIFEPRYKQMISDCLEKKSLFGVALIEEGPESGGVARPFKRGCLARILETKRLKNGRMNLLTIGQGRFQIVREIQREPFWKAEIELLGEELEEGIECTELGEKLCELIKVYSRLYFLLSHESLDLE